MFIRENKTKNRKTGKEYVAHRLIESYRTEKGPRQRVVMHLGELTLPKSEWKKLAFILENKLSGQEIILDSDEYLTDIANKLMDTHLFTQQRQMHQLERKEKQNNLTIDLDSIATAQSRSLGPELVAHTFWERLDFDGILKNCGFTPRNISLTKASILGRLIAPGSEQATLNWLKNRTALIELLEEDLSAIEKNALYDVADHLMDHKESIEAALRTKEQALFTEKRTLFLYDLTNTYFEGTSHTNDLTHCGKSKEKRSDCPLVTLALLVDANGFPVFSHIYKGNQSEPETLDDVLSRLGQYEARSLLTTQSTLIMDRGIATKDNLALIKEKGYQYIIIERRDVEKDYVDIFETAKDTFEIIKNASGDTVYVKSTPIEHGTRLLCLSEKRREKELAMDEKKEGRFIEDIQKLHKSIQKGTIKRTEKVGIRIGRLKQKYAAIAKYYTINLNLSDNEQTVIDLTLEKKEKRKNRHTLAGCYVIETSYIDWTAKEIWTSYTTLTKVESAFRSLKTDLGLRPVHHQSTKRIRGHLFISVLAYHLLNSIEQTLIMQEDHRRWQTIKQELSTHQRSTVIVTDEANQIHHLRISGTPETMHQQIYQRLDVTNPLKKTHQIAGRRL